MERIFCTLILEIKTRVDRFLNKAKKIQKGAKVAFIVTLICLILFTGVFCYFIAAAAIEKKSIASEFYETCIGMVMVPTKPISEEQTAKTVEKLRKTNKNYKIPTIYKNMYGFSTEEYKGYEVVFFDNEDTDKIAVYFHGGSYMWQPLIFHYDYCRYISEKLGLDIIMPIYPKAPDNNYLDALAWVYDYYVEYKLDPVAFFGDSAGGGLALSFAQYLSDRGGNLPEDIILFSPCLDLSLSNPEIEDYQESEPMLNADDLRRKFAYYAEGGSLADPYVSPIYCDYNKLGKVTVFVGTHEILYPDAKLLDEKLTNLNIEHNFYVYENQFHTFSILPLPERGVCLEQIKAVLAA